MNSLRHKTMIFSMSLASLLAISHLNASAADTIRLKKDVVPTFQTIDLKTDARETDFTGSVSIDLEVRNVTNSFIFHAEGMELDRVLFSNSDGEIDYTLEKGENGRITLTTEKELPKGSYKLEIGFTTSFDTKAVGLYRAEANGENYLFTQFEESDARKAFPCFDEPAFKFPYQLTLTIPEEHIAVSNTPVADESTSDGWKTLRFKKTKPLPSYLLAIAAGPLETVNVPNMPVPTRIVTTAGKSQLAGEAIKMLPPILNALVDYFGRPYPYEKLDLIAVPEFWPGAMENAGAITYREGILLIDPAAVTVSQKRSFATVTAHELAHMWFGDLVTMEWWDDLWLNESFATWMGNKVAEQVYPDYGLGVRSVRTGLLAMISDARPTAIAIRPPESETADLLRNIGTVYYKGQSVLLMIERWLGEDPFRLGVLDYIDKHSGGNATASDLWSSLSQVSGKNVENALGTFIVQPGVPLVTVDLVEGNKIRLRQRRFNNYGIEVEPLQWKIPVTIKYFDGQSVKQKSLLLSEEEQIVSVDSKNAPEWVFPNANGAGYYRWMIPKQMLATITENSKEFLNTRERIGLLGNLSALLDAGEITGGEYLNTLSLFADDTEPAVISSLISSLNKVKAAFAPDDLKAEFGMYVNKLLTPSIERFGLEARPDEDEEVPLLRPTLINWLADEGQSHEVSDYLKTLAKSYLKNASSIDPSVAGVSLITYTRDGDSTMFEDIKGRFESAQIPRERSRYLSAMGHFHDSALIERALDYALKGQLYPQEIGTIPFAVRSISEEYDQYVFDWMANNYEEIMTKIPATFASRMVYFASGCSQEKLRVAREFFTQEDRVVEGTHEALARVSAQVNDCVNLREREGESVADYLRQFASGK